MNVEFDKSFYKTLAKIKDQSTLKNIRKSILELENTKGLVDIKKPKEVNRL